MKIYQSSIFGRRIKKFTKKQKEELDKEIKLIVITAMGGMGKSTLAKKVIEEIYKITEEFTRIIWSSLKDEPPIKNILEDWLKFLSTSSKIGDTTNINQGLDDLIELAKEQRYLFILHSDIVYLHVTQVCNVPQERKLYRCVHRF